MTSAIVPSNLDRAQIVTEEIRAIKVNLVNNLLRLGELLSESKAGSYAELMGYDTFADWLIDSGLDMSERQAYYLIKIVDTAKALGIEREQLEASKMSKLKEIFALDPDEHGEQIKQLVAASSDMKLNDLRNAINDIREKSGLEPTSWFNFRVTDSQKQAIQEALELARQQYGQVINPNTDEVSEAPDGTLLSDVVCQIYIQTAKQDIAEQAANDYNIVDVEMV